MTKTIASRRPVLVDDRGTVPFDEALALQEGVVAELREDRGRETLFFFEHPPVYTIGRGGDAANLLGAPERLGVPLHRISRGGDATFHGPGQVVGYPILRLLGAERDVRDYLRKVEEVLIRTLASFGIRGERVAGKTGVWIGDRKIASIGVGFRRWVSFHGFALNVDPDFRYFDAIVPCALPGVTMTSMARELGEAPDAGSVRARLISDFGDVFRRTPVGDVPGKVPRRARRWTTRGEGADSPAAPERKPPWLRIRMPSSGTFFSTKKTLSDLGLTTVCEEAFCPNRSECWAHSTATFMLMGDTCTRSCGFCAVKHGLPSRLDPGEPGRVAEAARRLDLRHVVVTSVNRDDLPDGGASHFARTAEALREAMPECAIEVLVPDFRGDVAAIDVIIDAPITVLNHNVETVPRLYPRVRPGARFERSLDLMRRARRRRPSLRVKSGVMVGLGEEREELLDVFRALHDAGCDILTVGQYLRPTSEHLPVRRWIPPEEFDEIRREALAIGFRHVESGPFVRSSYHAWKHVEDSPQEASGGTRSGGGIPSGNGL